MSRWFRWYEGTSEDGKFRVVARNAEVTVATVMGVWAVLLEDASHREHRGVAVRGEDFYASVLDLTPMDLQHILEKMDDIGLISVGHGAITISKWKERQFETDQSDATNALRQRRFRAKTRNGVTVTAVTESNGAVTPRNGSVTERVTEEQNANCKNHSEINASVTPLRNGSVTAAKRPDTDTDTDTDTEKKIREPRANRATRLPNDWVLSENDRTFALGKGLPMQRVQIEALKFLNYWTAKGGQGATKTDWSKTWQNWILTATQGVPTNGRRTVHDAARDLHEQTVAAVLAFDEPAPRSLCDGTGPDVIRLLPPGRRQ